MLFGFQCLQIAEIGFDPRRIVRYQLTLHGLILCGLTLSWLTLRGLLFYIYTILG